MKRSEMTGRYKLVDRLKALGNAGILMAMALNLFFVLL